MPPAHPSFANLGGIHLLYNPSTFEEVIMLDQTVLAEFKLSLAGELIQPGEQGYDEARQVYNGMIDRRPRLIVRCADVADVIAAVNFGREHRMLIAVRGGGHNAGGLGVCDDGLVIDLSLINYTRVDPSDRMVRVGGGCTSFAVDHATHAFGLAVPTGFISTAGVGGLTLGGGLGYLAGKHGLTIDKLQMEVFWEGGQDRDALELSGCSLG